MSENEDHLESEGDISEERPALIEKESTDFEIDPKKIDQNALWVIKKLRAKGFEAYLTGGCVRDLLLNIVPKDFDVATSARPEEVRSIFRNCRLIGRRFLLAHVIFPGGKIIETATFRANPIDEVAAEEEAEDLLVLQDNVYGSMEQDAFRRDLTINGLFYDPVEGKVIDYVGGREDLKNKIIRTIGDPDIRLQEDPVRILRSIKFACRLGFDIEENTLSSMRKFSKELLRCAPSRLQEELFRMLTGGCAQKSFALALNVGALDFLMPELLEGMDIPLIEDGCLRAPLSDEMIKQPVYDSWQNMLGSLDEVTQRNCAVASSVAFTALLMPAYLRLEKSEQNERNWIDKLCVSWASRIRITRRDQDSIRLLLTAIPLFSLEKIHQKSAQYLVRKPWFREALLVYIIYLWAEGLSLDQVKIWKALAHASQKLYMQDKSGVRGAMRFRKRRTPFRRRKPRFQRA